MWKSRFTDEQITDALRRAGAGEAVTEICRQLGVSRQALYQWRSKYRGMGMMQRRLQRLEEENQKLKRLVADLSLEKHALQEGLLKAILPANGNSAVHILGDQPAKLQETEQEPALV
jgi:putative transposase